MSAAAPAAAPAQGRFPATRYRTSFAHTLHAEWIKFRTVRSTWWVVGSTVAVLVLFALMVAAIMQNLVRHPQPGATVSTGVDVVTSGVFFGQLVLAVLGILTITNEYSTGMIRSSLTAVPTRTPVVVAKSLVIALAAVVVGAVSLLLAYVVANPILSSVGLSPDLGASETWHGLGGTLLYLVLCILMAFGIGLLMRHSAGAIATALGLLFVLPIVAQLLQSNHVAREIAKYIPTNAGTAFATTTPADNLLSPTAGLIVMILWAVVPIVVGTVLLKRRDA